MPSPAGERCSRAGSATPTPSAPKIPKSSLPTGRLASRTGSASRVDFHSDWLAVPRFLARRTVVHVLDDLVARAGRRLEAAVIEDPDVTAAVFDQLAPLQLRRRLRDADPAH